MQELVLSRTAEHPTRYQSLDGLRAVSIFLVLLAHSKGSLGAVWAKYLAGLDLGNLGVRFFFVISGFLITSLLLNEFRQTGTVSIRKFYIRRFFRIFPAFYFYLAVLLVLAIVGLIVLPMHTILRSALYVADYPILDASTPTAYQSWFTVHTWSLSVEEQFYLIWPLLLLKLRPKRAISATIACIVAEPFLRLAAFKFLPSYRESLPEAFELVSDALATGCLLALIRATCHSWNPYARLLRSKLTVPLLALSCYAAYRVKASHEQIWLLAGVPLANFAIALIIDDCITAENIYTRFLNLSWISSIGVLSYSLYLWQEVFLVQGRWTSHPWHWFPLSWLFSFAAAWCSYRLVEKPFLSLRESLFSRRTQDRGRPAVPTNMASVLATWPELLLLRVRRGAG
jgi:peptidoglycan/LPS O-acetylase OafA/YrhL